MKKKLIQRMTFVKTPIFSKKYYETKKKKQIGPNLESNQLDSINQIINTFDWQR